MFKTCLSALVNRFLIWRYRGTKEKRDRGPEVRKQGMESSLSFHYPSISKSNVFLCA